MSWGPFDMTGLATIVTGGAKGIGRGIVQRYLEAGARVVLADVDERAAHDALRALNAGDRATAIALDISADGAGEQLVRRCVDRFGKLDVLVNNAGIYPSQPMLEMDPALFDKVYRINLRGLAFASKAAGLQMVKQGKGGKIVNIASIDSLHPSMVGLAAYDSSKGGVLMFTRSFALEMAPHHVQVNGIAPGGVSTEGTSEPLKGSGMSADQMKQMLDQFVQRIPLGRMGMPDDIAKVAVFLGSSAADYVTGTTIVVDGGRLLA
jgi:2-deoxy-D-gluconate 3-dehydrogenase